MNKGLWVWPSDPKGQQSVIRRASGSPHLVQAMAALLKSRDGMSNAELDDSISDNSNWMTLWVIRQLTSLGFLEYKVDFFGGPAKYRLSELGKSVAPTITGQPIPKPPTPIGSPSVQAQSSQVKTST